jgi:AcrR family transcriptional regulator
MQGGGRGRAMAATAGRRGEARARVVHAALTLFAERGVNGTSLQMIAGELGVTKAAVYHQFQTKEDIVLAVFRPVFDDMAGFVAAAEAEPTPRERADAALRGLIGLVLDHRRLAPVFHGDPAVLRLIRDDAGLQGVAERLRVLLTGPAPTPAARVAVSMVAGGLMQSGVDALLSDLPDAVLRAELLASSRRLLRLDDLAGTPD